MAVKFGFDEYEMKHFVDFEMEDPENGPTDEEYLELVDALMQFGFKPPLKMKFMLTLKWFKVKIKKLFK